MALGLFLFDAKNIECICALCGFDIRKTNDNECFCDDVFGVIVCMDCYNEMKEIIEKENNVWTT